MKSLAKFFSHNFDDGEFKLYDKNGNKIYCENSVGYWYKCKYDNNSNLIYYENADRCWYKQEYDNNNNIIYYENSNGYIDDYRPKCNGKTVVIDGIEYELRRK